MNPDFRADFRADEADVLEQRRELREDPESGDLPPADPDVEADPADLQEQSVPVPSEEDDWPGA